MRYLLILILIIISFLKNQPGEASRISSTERSQIHRLATTFHVFETSQRDRVWPDFELSRLPTIVHFKNGHLYAFQFQGSKQLWRPFSLPNYLVFFCEKHPQDITTVMLHPAMPVEGKRAFVFRLEDQTGNSADLSLLTFIHERFHLHQFRHFVSPLPLKGDYQDHRREENLALMEIENRLLVRFLKEKEISSKIDYLKSYLAVSLTRKQLIQAMSWEWEEHQQRMEGMADYVSLKACQIFSIISDFDLEKFILHMREKKTVGLTSLSEDAIKGRHYFVGTVLGFALDLCTRLNWKKQVEQGASLHALLAQSLPLTVKERQERFQEATRMENFPDILKAVSQRLQEEQSQYNTIKQEFERQEGVAVFVALPKQRTSAGGRHEKSYHFNSEAIFLQESSCCTSQDRRWNLQLASIPFVLEDPQGGRTFKMKAETLIYLDGKPVFLKELLNQPDRQFFSSLSWQELHSQFDCTLPGYLSIENGQVSIQFHASD